MFSYNPYSRQPLYSSYNSSPYSSPYVSYSPSYASALAEARARREREAYLRGIAAERERARAAEQARRHPLYNGYNIDYDSDEDDYPSFFTSPYGLSAARAEAERERQRKVREEEMRMRESLEDFYRQPRTAQTKEARNSQSTNVSSFIIMPCIVC